MSIRAQKCLLAALCGVLLVAGIAPVAALDRAAPRASAEEFPIVSEARLMGDDTRTRTCALKVATTNSNPVSAAAAEPMMT